MKISIITSVFNNVTTIRDAVESVLSQTYDDIEYIVIDGASTDGTTEVIKDYGDRVHKFVSEPDKGIYDGLNKGIAHATGDVIGFLHSDDLYADPNVVTRVAQVFQEENAEAVYGDLIYTSKTDTTKVLRYWKSRDFEHRLLARGWMPAHPTFFVKRSLYEQYGNFDITYRIAADYDFMLRVLSRGIKAVYLPLVMYKMRMGGESNKSVKNIVRKMKEDHRALRSNNVGGFYSLAVKNFSKLPQLFRKQA